MSKRDLGAPGSKSKIAINDPVLQEKKAGWVAVQSGNANSGFKKMWFVLDGTHLAFFDKEGGKIKGEMDLSFGLWLEEDYNVLKAKQKGFFFTLGAAGAKRLYVLMCESNADRIDWVGKFRNIQVASDKSDVKRILITGNAGSGKTSYLDRLIDGKFHDAVIVGGSPDSRKKIVNRDGKDTKILLFEPAGRELFAQITMTFYRDCAGVMIFYHDEEQFEAVGTWLADARQYGRADMPIILVNTKADLEPAVPFEKAKEYATKEKLRFESCSAKTGAGVDNLFDRIVELCFRYGGTPAGHAPPSPGADGASKDNCLVS